MIVSTVHQFVLLTAPKTASTSFHRWFTLPGYPAFDPFPDDQHRMEVLPEHANYFRWTVWREPLDRAVSLWSHLNGDLRRHGWTEIGIHPFAWLLAGGALKPFYQRTQADWLGANRIDLFVRFDQLPGSLLEVPFALPPGAMPQVNATQHPPWQEVYAERPGVRRAVEHWGERDYRLLDGTVK